MEFMKSFFGGKKKEGGGRENAGGDFMAVPPQAPGEITEDEAVSAEKRRLEKERLEKLIVEIEGDPKHLMRSDLTKLNQQLREFN